MTLSCPHCGFANPVDSVHCGRCRATMLDSTIIVDFEYDADDDGGQIGLQADAVSVDLDGDCRGHPLVVDLDADAGESHLEVDVPGDTQATEARSCPECGHENSALWEHCPECGRALDAHEYGSGSPHAALSPPQPLPSTSPRPPVAPVQTPPSHRPQPTASQHPNTGLGTCPRCGSGHLTRVRKTDEKGGWQALACCTGCFIWWPILFLIPFLRTARTDMHCCSCGYEWPA